MVIGEKNDAVVEGETRKVPRKETVAMLALADGAFFSSCRQASSSVATLWVSQEARPRAKEECKREAKSAESSEHVKAQSWEKVRR